MKIQRYRRWMKMRLPRVMAELAWVFAIGVGADLQERSFSFVIFIGPFCIEFQWPRGPQSPGPPNYAN